MRKTQVNFQSVKFRLQKLKLLKSRVNQGLHSFHLFTIGSQKIIALIVLSLTEVNNIKRSRQMEHTMAYH